MKPNIRFLALNQGISSVENFMETHGVSWATDTSTSTKTDANWRMALWGMGTFEIRIYPIEELLP
jgi:hypothetical protein